MSGLHVHRARQDWKLADALTFTAEQRRTPGGHWLCPRAPEVLQGLKRSLHASWELLSKSTCELPGKSLTAFDLISFLTRASDLPWHVPNIQMTSGCLQK